MVASFWLTPISGGLEEGPKGVLCLVINLALSSGPQPADTAGCGEGEHVFKAPKGRFLPDSTT